MKEDVKQYIDMKMNVIYDYFTVPASAQNDVDTVKNKICELGEECADAAEFENRFNSSPVSAQYNMLFTKCTPKPPNKRTKEEKRAARSAVKEMFTENKGEVIREMVKDDLQDAFEDAKEELSDEITDTAAAALGVNDILDDVDSTREAKETASNVFGFFRKKRAERKKKKQSGADLPEDPEK